MDARALIQRSQKSLEIGDQLSDALIFAVCKDGSVYCLEQVTVRPGFNAVPVYPENLVERLKALPRKS